MDSIHLKILGEPFPKQSARFRSFKSNWGKTSIRSYQPEKIKDKERNIAFDVKSQLPKGFIPFDQPIGVEILFVFPPLKSWSKKKKRELEEGQLFFKDTKPDLSDNLNKGLFDAMEGIVFVNDSRICMVRSRKIYGLVPRTEVTIYKL